MIMLNCDTSVCDCLQRNMNSFKLGMINHCNCNSTPVKCVKSKKKKAPVKAHAVFTRDTFTWGKLTFLLHCITFSMLLRNAFTSRKRVSCKHGIREGKPTKLELITTRLSIRRSQIDHGTMVFHRQPWLTMDDSALTMMLTMVCYWVLTMVHWRPWVKIKF